MSRSIGEWLSKFSQRRCASRSRRERQRRGFVFEPLESRLLLSVSGPDHALTDHVHHHLAIYLEGQEVSIPADIGVDASGNIFSFVHTHDPDGLLHVHPLDSGPPSDYPTLDDFFTTWRANAGAAGNNPDAFFSSTQLMNDVVDATHRIVMFVNGVPNDEFQNYEMHDGDQIVLSYETIPGLNDPVFNPVNDVTMAAGKTFIVPLDAFDPNDQNLTYAATSDNANVTAEVITGGRSIRLNVSGTDADGDAFSGELVFRLFEDLAPETTARIIGLVDAGFYDSLTFHRIIDGFVAQGGDPLGTGTGGTANSLVPLDASLVGDFSDEFTGQLTFTGFGQLAMANSGDDTNDSQFFITDSNLSLNVAASPGQAPPQHLNFNHTILGQLVSGFDVFERIMRTDTGTGDRPVNPVTINSATVFTDTQHGVLRLSAQDGFTGNATISVTATNQSGLSAQRNFGVTVLADDVDDRPFLGPVTSFVSNQNTPVTFQVDATDLEGDNLTFVVRNPNNFSVQPSNVTISINPIDADTAEIMLTPDTNFFGTISMLIGVRDQTARGGLALDDRSQFDTQQITLTVNNPPTLNAVGDHQTDEDTQLVFGVSGTDAEGDVLTFVVRDANDFSMPPPNLSVNILPLTNNMSRLTITPAADFNGTVDVIIGVRDQTARGDLPLDDPSQFITEPITITVNAVNDPPTADSQNLSVNQDTALDIVLMADDGDPELDQPLTFEIVEQPTNGTISNFDPDAGSLTYTPNAGFAGTDSFTFHVLEEDGTPSNVATVSIAVNDPPVLNPVVDQTTDEDTAVTFEISASDTEGDNLTFVIGVPGNLNMAPPNVTVQITTVDPSTRQVTITPNPNFNGTVQLLVGVRDQTARGGLPLNDPAQFDAQPFTLTVNAVNDAPTATAANLQVGANTALAIQLQGSDVDLDPLTFAIVNQPTHGTLTGFNANTGQVTYTSSAGFSGADSFTFTVNDGQVTSQPATVTITVSGGPVMNAVGNRSTAEDTPITFNISATDTGTDTLTFVVRDANNFAQLPADVTVNIETVDRTTRRVTLTPRANFNGSVALVAGVTDQPDAAAMSDFDTQPFTLTVTAVNDPPTTVSQTVQLQPGMPANIRLTVDDGDPELNQAVTFEIVTQPSAGTIQQFDASMGTLVYQPGPKFTGSDSFTFRVRDDAGAVSQIATVTINGRTDAPIHAAKLKHKTLKIKGSGAADQIDISLNDAGNMLVVQLNNNATQMFPLGKVKRIKIDGRGGDDVITIAPNVSIRAKIKGGAGNDNITGGAGKDRLYGNSGNDTIDGGAGNDKIRGGSGNDSLMGGAGNDKIKGGKGNDVIEGGDGNDRLWGNKGDDTIMGGAGNDRIKGGRGHDVVDQDGTGQDETQDPFRELPSIAVGTQGSLSDPALLGERIDLRPGAPSADHLFDHVTGPVDYNALGITSNPPTYGPHHSSSTPPLAPIPPGVYTTVQDDANLVHNLEHGQVWISYDPGLLSSSDVSELERLVRAFGDGAGVVLTPRPADDTAIALASWNRLLTLGSFDAQQIRQFAETNRAHAPEGYEPN